MKKPKKKSTKKSFSKFLFDTLPRADRTGQSYGLLRVKKYAGYRLPKCGKKEFYWLCVCECGNEKVTSYQNLRSGDTKSCGCLQIKNGKEINRKHQKCFTPEYNSWASMKQRCTNKKHHAYKNYGGRGIIICERWLNNFENFYKDMGRKPGKVYSIDRINPDGDYEPNNCRWATPLQQRHNRRKAE